MDSARGGGACRSGNTASEEVAALQLALQRHAERLADVRKHALAVALLSWDSPAGGSFRSYLSERCIEFSGTLDLLDSAVRDLGEYRRVVRAVEAVQDGAGL